MDGNGENPQFFHGKGLVHHQIETTILQMDGHQVPGMFSFSSPQYFEGIELES